MMSDEFIFRQKVLSLLKTWNGYYIINNRCRLNTLALQYHASCTKLMQSFYPAFSLVRMTLIITVHSITIGCGKD